MTKSALSLFQFTVLILMISCKSSETKLPGIGSTRDVESQLVIVDGSLVRVDKFPRTFILRGHGPVDFNCNPSPCNPADLEKMPVSQVRGLAKVGFWKEYVQKELPNQSDIDEDKRKFQGFLDLEGSYVNGQREGEWKKFREDGTVLSTTGFLAGKKHGPERRYNRTGSVITQETNFNNGERTGAHYKKTEAGLLEREGSYEKDQAVGRWTLYYFTDETGKPLTTSIKRTEYSCEANAKSGDYKDYNPKSVLSSEGRYDKGFRTGLWKNYHPNGKLESEGNYEPIKPLGTPEVCFQDAFAPTGEAKKPIFKKSGVWKHYYENGRVFAEGNNDGTRVGDWSFYSNAGVLRFRGKMANDIMMSEGEAFASDGSLFGKGKFLFSVLVIDQETGDIKDTFRPSVPFTYFKNGKKSFDIKEANESGDTKAIQYDDNGKVVGEGPIATGTTKKNGCWKWEGRTAYFIMDRENAKMASMMCK